MYRSIAEVGKEKPGHFSASCLDQKYVDKNQSIFHKHSKCAIKSSLSSVMEFLAEESQWFYLLQLEVGILSFDQNKSLSFCCFTFGLDSKTEWIWDMG